MPKTKTNDPGAHHASSGHSRKPAKVRKCKLCRTMQNERESNKETDEEERDTLTVSWCHLAQYLSSKYWAIIV